VIVKKNRQKGKQSHFKPIQSHFFRPQTLFLGEFRGFSTNSDNTFYAKRTQWYVIQTQNEHNKEDIKEP